MTAARLFLALLSTFLLWADASAQEDRWAEVPVILNRIKAPTFPARLCNILDFGAIPSPSSSDVEAPELTVNRNTQAFLSAIDYCHTLGGGTVFVPPAQTFITSAIKLKSNISLEISRDATIRFTRQTTKYPLVFTRWEGIELMNYSPFVYAFEEENIRITGEGTLDGNCDCDHWWPWKGTWSRQCWETTPENQTNARNALFQMAEDELLVQNRVFGEGHYLRPQFIQPYRSRNVVIEGITILNSPMWIVHPVLCQNVIIRNLNISSLGPNSDGVDPESCRDVWIHNVTFNNGDDNIAIKSGRNQDGRRINVTCENVVVQNCRMQSGHGGLTLGSCISGGVRNIFAEDCTLDSPQLDSAIRIKNNALRGGLLENFYLRNIWVGTVAKQVVEIDFYYEEGPNAPFVPVIRNFQMENITLENTAQYSVYARGYPGHPNASFIGIEMENVRLNGVRNDPHFVMENVDEVTMEGVWVNGEEWDYSIG